MSEKLIMGDTVGGMVEKINTNSDEFDALKNDYATYKDSNSLKIAKVEKDLNDYQQTMASMNINQEAKQTASGYGVVSLPKNAANGQVSVGVKGLTATNLVKNGNFANGTTDWNLQDNWSITDKLSFTTPGGISGYNATPLSANLIIGNKYYYKYNLNNIVGDIGHARYQLNGLTTMLNMTTSGIKSDIAVATETPFYIRGSGAGDNFTMDDIIVIDLTATFGTGNEPTVEQCDKMFVNYFDGTKSTVSASRLKSVGKNLFDWRAWYSTGNFGTRTIYSFDKEGSLTVLNNDHRAVNNRSFLQLFPNTRYTIYPEIASRVDVGDFDLNIRIAESYSTKPSTPLEFTTGATGKTTFAFASSATMPRNVGKIMLCIGSEALTYAPYTESTAYITAKDENGNIAELRSLPNGTKDEINAVTGVKTQRVSKEKDFSNLTGWRIQYQFENTARYTITSDLFKGHLLSTLCDAYCKIGDVIFPVNNNSSSVDEECCMFSGLTDGCFYVRVRHDRITTTFENYLQSKGATLSYQLAEPQEIPIEVSGTLLSYPSGTVYVEPVVADAGVYNNGMTVLHQDLPIKAIEKISKIDFNTGLETSLNVANAVVAQDKLSFTHPELQDGNIVFFEYEYDVESTQGETTISYYDSRYTIKDSVTGKFYKWEVTVADGVPGIGLVEV